MSIAFPRSKWSEPAWSGPDLPLPPERPMTAADAWHIREQLVAGMRRAVDNMGVPIRRVPRGVWSGG